MKKKYKAPRVEIKDVEVEDIIATSPPDTGFDGGDFDLGGMGSDDLLP